MVHLFIQTHYYEFLISAARRHPPDPWPRGLSSPLAIVSLWPLHKQGPAATDKQRQAVAEPMIQCEVARNWNAQRANGVGLAWGGIAG